MSDKGHGAVVFKKQKRVSGPRALTVKWPVAHPPECCSPRECGDKAERSIGVV